MASSLAHATQLQTVLLDVDELTEHTDNAIKFLSDISAARFYKLAASKVGVPDYRDLVTQKVRTAEELYRFMVNQFNQSRTFLLELTVVIILVIELFYLFFAENPSRSLGITSPNSENPKFPPLSAQTKLRDNMFLRRATTLDLSEIGDPGYEANTAARLCRQQQISANELRASCVLAPVFCF